MEKKLEEQKTEFEQKIKWMENEHKMEIKSLQLDLKKAHENQLTELKNQSNATLEAKVLEMDMK